MLLIKSGMLSVSALESGVPSFQSVGGRMDLRIHQVMEHIRQGVVNQMDSSFEIEVGLDVHGER